MSKKLVCIDVSHPAQFNFYVNTIKKLSCNFKVLVTIIDRGNLVNIAREELKNVKNTKIVIVGSHSGGAWSIIFQANLLKFLKLIVLYFKNQPIIQVSNHYIAGLAAKLFGLPNIQMQDDIERSFFTRLQFLAADQFSVPQFVINDEKKITPFKALKEWAYLSPDYFRPQIGILDNYKIKPYRYIFVREVSNKSFNYRNQSSNLIAKCTDSFPEDYKVLLSLEDKKTIDQYPQNWILLEEPIEDFHSLLYFSRIVISSGDSMAREGALLGVPSIYCGIREMEVNNVLIMKGKLFHTKIENINLKIKKILQNKDVEQQQKKFRSGLRSNWDDVTEFIINSIKAIIKY